ncbi:glycosyltransferase family 2 protein [Flavonifractor sp. An52]|uniref:glycosyltransferase family 2 protein n=1 Tax=Flavonifractor sp. An52 TaxID=1965642 RepID=UPI000B38272A|nr:glycosyltransferase family 2 protein [Flavonifractor sp. An52]
MEQLVSVIIPIYKVEAYLKRCVDSVLAQTYTNLEVILVDDGSPDGCGAICDSYAEQDPRVRVIHKVNGGMSDARNAGLKIASGEYISFIDSDDWIDSGYIFSLVQKIEETNSDFVISGITYVYENLRTQKKAIPQSTDTVQLVSNSLMGYACNKLYRKVLLDKANILFKDMTLREDLFFNLTILARAPKLKYEIVNECGYYYIQRQSSSLHSRQEVPAETVCNFLEELKKLLEELDKHQYRSTEIYNYVAYTLLTDNILKNIYRNRKLNCSLRYVSKLFSSVSRSDLRLAYAYNWLFKTTWFTSKVRVHILYVLFWKIKIGKKNHEN